MKRILLDVFSKIATKCTFLDLRMVKFTRYDEIQHVLASSSEDQE
jgi:hypothetical protein